MMNKETPTALPNGLPDLPEGWEYKTLGSLVQERGICYGIVQPGTPTLDGVPIVRVNNIRNRRVITDDVLRVHPGIEERYRRSRLTGGEVLLTLVGTLGEVAVAPKELRGWNVARAIGVVPVDADIGGRWVSLCLGSSTLQHLIHIWATTTVQATFNLCDLAKLPIPIPPPPVRESIAHVLGTLDDKIELNRRMNRTLEGLARALFRSWFVDFDPVRAKADGRTPAGMDAATAALFPDHFEDSELGKIPAGWRVAGVGGEFQITMGQSPPGSTYNEAGEGIPFFQGRADFGFRYPSLRVYCTAPTRFANAGDSLVSVRAPVGDVNLADRRCCVGRGLAAVRHHTGSRSFTYYTMRFLEPDFGRFEAEGTVFGSINKRSFHELRVVAPPEHLVQQFERTAFPFDELIEQNEAQSRTLAALRDALLPKLISGELRVPDAERTAEEVA